MVKDAGTAQAQALLRELDGHVEDIARRLEAAEQRNQRAYLRGASRRDPIAGELRRELHEVQRMIHGLHRRFPEALPAGSDNTLASGLSPEPPRTSAPDDGHRSEINRPG